MTPIILPTCFRRFLAAISCATMLLAIGAAGLADAPRVAVWNPVNSAQSSRFRIDPKYLDEVSAWLRDAGVSVDRLTTAQVADAATFSAEKYDALLLEGDAVPTAMLSPCKQYLDAGGVLIALAADNPFEIKIAQDAQGAWRLDPEKPDFAWQTTALHDHLGMKFHWSLDMAYSGILHTPTDLLKQYLPTAGVVKKGLKNRWFVPKSGKFYPLVRSQQAAGGDYTPQVYLVVNGRRRAILSASRIWTGEANKKLWPHGKEMVAALVRLAKDLRDGKADLSRQLAVTVSETVVTPEPLEFRVPVGKGVDPENATPLARWGRFDGSRLELGKALDKGEKLSLPEKPDDKRFPSALDAGATLELALPALGDGPAYLRIRGAYKADRAALAAKLGDVTVWNESFVHRISAEAMNMGFKYDKSAVEFTRIVYLPPDAMAARTLTLHNPGAAPVYFDAVQIERPTEPARTVGLGLHTGVELAYDGKTALTKEICKDWTWLRCTARPWWVGPPDDPKRWEKFDNHIERYLALSDHCQIILEGTPEWAAISPQRYAGGGNRKHMVAPDNEKYREIVEHAVAKFADRVEDWELWNESNIRHFWVGTPQEFADFCKMAIPIIRKGDPTARIIIGGMAGTTVSAVDPFAVAMVENEITKQADLFAFHCYAPAGLWDVGYGLIEGHLFSLGCGMEIYANEQGFGWREGEKWLRQGEFSPDIQARLYDIGMGRLMANGVAKVTDFNAGGDDNTLGIIDENGQPRPAYAIFADYLNLTGRGARRLDVSLTAPDGGPLRGVYVAASTHDDGAVTLIANPADVPALHPAKDTANRTPDAAVPVRIRLPLPRAAEYTVSADEGGKSRPAEIKVHRQGNAAWAEVALALTGRTVVRLAPK